MLVRFNHFCNGGIYGLENGFKVKIHQPIFVAIRVVKLLFCFSWTGELILEVPPYFSLRMSLSHDVSRCLMICVSLCLMMIFAGRGLKFQILPLICALSQQFLSVHFILFMQIEYISGMTKTEQNRHAV